MTKDEEFVREYAEFTLEHCGRKEKLIMISKDNLDNKLDKIRKETAERVIERFRELYENTDLDGDDIADTLKKEFGLKELEE